MKEYIDINESTPGLRFSDQKCEDGTPVTVCEYDGDLTADKYIEILMDVDIFICTGRIETNGLVSCRANLIARKGISAGTYIRVGGSVHCCNGGVTAKEYIYVDGRIDVRGDITAGGYINCEGIGCVDGDIIAGDCIMTQTSIKATGDIDCGKRIFAGVSLDRTNETCDDLIICRLLDNGEVCAGRLIEGGGWTPEEGWC